MSGFSDVDASGLGDQLAAYLDRTDAGLVAMKSYMASALRRAAGGGKVLDLGCGVGHDLVRLAGLGLSAVGVDASADMLARARARAGQVAVLAQADGARLPLRSGTIDGCRIERVLQHVPDPDVVIAEVARVLRPGGVLVTFEPDYSTFRFDSDDPEDAGLLGRLHRVRHPRIGGELVELVERHGFLVDDVVTESSRGHALDRTPIDPQVAVPRAVAEGRLEMAVGKRWLDEQRERAATGRFLASWDKVLVVAHLAR